MFSRVLTKFFCAFIIFLSLNPSKSLGNAASFSAKNNKIKSKWEEIIIFFLFFNDNFDLENKNIFAFYFAYKFFVTGYLDIVFYDLRQKFHKGFRKLKKTSFQKINRFIVS
jgi:hypothetical protein